MTFELDRSEVIDASLYYSGTFEAETERAINRICRAGMVAVDVGANIGYHTFRMASAVGSSGLVLAVEPTTRAYERLMRNASLNNFSNIKYAKVALADYETGPANIGFQSSYRLDGRNDITQETMRLTTLDALVEEYALPRVDFIKIDVDGYEGKVFRGADQTIKTWRPGILFEISPNEMGLVGDDAGQLLSLLDSHGYAITDERGKLLGEQEIFCLAGSHSANLVALPRECV